MSIFSIVIKETFGIFVNADYILIFAIVVLLVNGYSIILTKSLGMPRTYRARADIVRAYYERITEDLCLYTNK